MSGDRAYMIYTFYSYKGGVGRSMALTNFMLHNYPKNANGGQLSLLPAGRRAGPEQVIEVGAASVASAAAGGGPGIEDMAAPDPGNENEAQSASSDQRSKDEFTLYAD